MKQTDPIQDQVEQTLNSLDGLRRAKPTPFFHTRVKARMERESERKRGIVVEWLFRPRIQLAMVICLLLLNVGTLVILSTGSSSMNNRTRDTWLEYMVDEYDLSATELYDISSDQP